uniref:Elongation of very long chain fatty acids protein n=1 Tax=Timema cristinae TaxID=61476 RepID=A0A7R9HAX4_TIMCR|nr:unnamed protein product [Timema cristinae]
MAELMHLVKFNYNDMIGAKKDPMVDSWLFMSSPVPILTILALYLYFVLSLGPNFMNSREPFHLQRLLVAYNLYQVLFSSWLCTLGLNPSLAYQAVPPSNRVTALISRKCGYIDIIFYRLHNHLIKLNILSDSEPSSTFLNMAASLWTSHRALIQ